MGGTGESPVLCGARNCGAGGPPRRAGVEGEGDAVAVAGTVLTADDGGRGGGGGPPLLAGAEGDCDIALVVNKSL